MYKRTERPPWEIVVKKKKIHGPGMHPNTLRAYTPNKVKDPWMHPPSCQCGPQPMAPDYTNELKLVHH